MYKITLSIDGMACSMCEAHMNETIRKAVPGAKKVTASHVKKKAEFICDEIPDENTLKAAIAATGYEMTDFGAEPFRKKGFSLFGHKD